MMILRFINFLAVTFTLTCWSGRGAFAPKNAATADIQAAH